MAGLLNPHAASRLTARQASKLLNSIVAAIYLHDFWVFDQDEAVEPPEEEEEKIPQRMPDPILKPAPIVKPEPPVIVKPDPLSIFNSEPLEINKPEPVPVPVNPHPSVRQTYK